MIIQSIELNNFRNYENLQISFDEGTNILFGDNAQGYYDKTNSVAYASGEKISYLLRKYQYPQDLMNTLQKNDRDLSYI